MREGEIPGKEIQRKTCGSKEKQVEIIVQKKETEMGK